MLETHRNAQTGYLLLSILIQGLNFCYPTTCAVLAENTAGTSNWLHLSFCDQTKTDEEMLPFKKLGTGYYYFGTEQEVTWYKALHICQTYNAGLVSIESAPEMQQLSNYLLSKGYQEGRFWTSGNDLDVEGSFFWSGTGNAFAYTNWIPGEPNNGYEREHCVNLWTKVPRKYEWNDIDCKYKMFYICEKR